MGGWPDLDGPGVFAATVDMKQRESWRALVESLPGDLPFNGVAHLLALDGHGPRATTRQVADDIERDGRERAGDGAGRGGFRLDP